MWALTAIVILLAALLLYVFAGGPSLPAHTDAAIDAALQSDLSGVIVGQTGYDTASGLDIWYESLLPAGPPKGTVLLIMANGGDALIWPPAFFRPFVAAGYRVIRYDHHGTGLSDWVKNWDRRQPYSVANMAGDAVSVLEAVGVRAAHLVGLSMGGMVAQEVALQHPARVASLTLMMTSGFVGDPALPGLTTRYLLASTFKGLPLLRYRLLGGERNLIKERLAKQVSVSGAAGLDLQELADIVLYDLRHRRGFHLRGAMQHQTAVTVSGSRYERLKTLRVPTLVVHGTADPVIPVEHGRKLVELIPGARALWLPGIGHLFPPPDTPGLVAHKLTHLENATPPAA